MTRVWRPRAAQRLVAAAVVGDEWEAAASEVAAYVVADAVLFEEGHAE